jgi:hypothetical protein
MNQISIGDTVVISQPPDEHDTKDFRGCIGTVLLYSYGQWGVATNGSLVYCDERFLKKMADEREAN